MKLRSFKLQLALARIRIVPDVDLDGCAFAGPGVDVIGDAARTLFPLADPLVDWLRAREPGVAVRSMSCDLTTGRVLVTYVPEGAPPDTRPYVLRIQGPGSIELLDLARPLVARLNDAARAGLAKRAAAARGE